MSWQPICNTSISIRTGPWAAASNSAQRASTLGLPTVCRSHRCSRSPTKCRLSAKQGSISQSRYQLELARRYDLPVVLHCVRAFGEVMRELRACPPPAAIFHGFIGSPEQARQALAAGHYLSFGERTFRSPKTVEAMRATPLDRLFFETDDSETPIEEIYARAAESLGRTTDELITNTLKNYRKLFERK